MVIVSQARTVIGVMWVKGWTGGSICLATIVIKSILITFFITTPKKEEIGLKIDAQAFNHNLQKQFSIMASKCMVGHRITEIKSVIKNEKISTSN